MPAFPVVIPILIIAIVIDGGSSSCGGESWKLRAELEHPSCLAFETDLKPIKRFQYVVCRKPSENGEKKNSQFEFPFFKPISVQIQGKFRGTDFSTWRKEKDDDDVSKSSSDKRRGFESRT